MEGGSTPSSLALDIAWGVAEGVLDPQGTGYAVLTTPSMVEHVLDGLWLVSLACEVGEAGVRSSRVGRMGALVRTLGDGIQSSNQEEQEKEVEGVPFGLLKRRLPETVLAAAGVIPSAKVFGKWVVQAKTRRYFTQHKYNLMREESVGYAKLATTLNSPHPGGVGGKRKQVMSLIGYFSLDPNRVLDIMLEAAESCEEDLAQDAVHLMVSQYERSTIAQLLGFKFQSYTGDVAVGPVTPTSLFHLAARLLHQDVISLADLDPHLSPAHEVCVSSAKEQVSEIWAGAESMTKVNLSMSSDEAAAAREATVQRVMNPTPDLENQRIGLGLGLLAVAPWEVANGYLHSISEYNPVSDPRVAAVLSARLAELVEPVFHAVSASGSKYAAIIYNSGAGPSLEERLATAPVSDLAGLMTASPALQLLEWLSTRVALDVKLYAKLVRVFGSGLRPSSSLSEDNKGVVVDVFRTILVPALGLVSSNPGIASDVYAEIKGLPYVERFQMYAHWASVGYEGDPLLGFVRAKTEFDIRSVLRRLSQENYRQYGRVLGKLSHGNPIVVFESILSQLSTYDNLIEPVVEAFKYMTPLSHDVLSYCLIAAMADPTRSRLKEDESTVSSWLQAIAKFTGLLSRKYTRVTLPPILQYIGNQLKAGSPLDLLVLKELVSSMTGVEVMEEMTESQLSALGGGATLRSLGSTFVSSSGSDASSKLVSAVQTDKATARLMRALREADLVVPFLILIAQQKTAIIHQTELKSLKPIGDLYDACHETFMQYIAFLRVNADADSLEARIPQPKESLEEYSLDAATAYFLTRLGSRPFATPHSIVERVLGENAQGGSSSNKGKKSAWGDVVVVSDEEANRLMASLEEGAACVLSEAEAALLPPSFYALFWALSLYDLQVPSAEYRVEKTKLVREMEALKKGGGGAGGGGKTLTSSERSSLARLERTVKDLEAEEAIQAATVEYVQKILVEGSPTWFSASASPVGTTRVFMLRCVFPRVPFSVVDAAFVSALVRKMVALSPPGFDVETFFGTLVAHLRPWIFASSMNEAGRIGRFVEEMMVFLEELRVAERVTPELVLNVHTGLSYQARGLLGSKEHMEIRNGLVLLTKLKDKFPVVESHVNALHDVAGKVLGRERAHAAANPGAPRSDVELLTTRYEAMLRVCVGVSEDAFLAGEKAGRKRRRTRGDVVKGPMSGGVTTDPVAIEIGGVGFASSDFKRLDNAQSNGLSTALVQAQVVNSARDVRGASPATMVTVDRHRGATAPAMAQATTIPIRSVGDSSNAGGGEMVGSHWVERYSTTYNRKFWKNTITGKSTWIDPLLPQPPQIGRPVVTPTVAPPPPAPASTSFTPGEQDEETVTTPSGNNDDADEEVELIL